MNHTHRCACGTTLNCTQEPDKCAVPNNFACPNCEMQERDDYFSASIHAENQRREQEGTRGHGINWWLNR